MTFASTIAAVPFDPSSGVTDVILGLAALATLVALIRSWRSFWDTDFTPADRRLAIQVSVFLLPPLVVLLHELGHLFAAYGVGADVRRFRYGLFEGSVTVAGRLRPSQFWVIAIAGNIVSVVLGAALVVAGVRGVRLRAPLRYVLVAGGLLSLVFSLIGYPVLSVLTDFGDWVVIYDFDRTPAQASITAALHIAALWGMRRWWRTRGKATLFAIGTGTGARLSELQAAIENAPTDIAPRLALADFYARNGELGLARSTLDEAVAACGDVPRLHLGRARLSLYQGRWNDAMLAARAGLQAEEGDEAVRQRLWANLALALTQMEKPDHALTAYAHLTSPVVDDARVRYGRGLVRMAAGDAEGGRSDLETVVQHLPEGDLLRRWAEARLQGRPLEEEPNPKVPAYQRGSGPPPAPIAGI